MAATQKTPQLQLYKCTVCKKPAPSACSVCATPYCSAQCQRGDWACHRVSVEHQFVVRQVEQGEQFVNSDNEPTAREAFSRALKYIVRKGLLRRTTKITAEHLARINDLVRNDSKEERLLEGSVEVCDYQGNTPYRTEDSLVAWDTHIAPDATTTVEIAFHKMWMHRYGLAMSAVKEFAERHGVAYAHWGSAMGERDVDVFETWELAFPDTPSSELRALYEAQHSELAWLRRMAPRNQEVLAKHFYAAPHPSELVELMDREVLAYCNFSWSEFDRDELALRLSSILIAFFVIHPFACGNGRTARILANVLLGRYTSGKYWLVLRDRDHCKQYDRAVVSCVRACSGPSPGTDTYRPFQRFLLDGALVAATQ